MAEIKTLLDDVIETELANLRTLPSGNEERAKAIRDLAALHKLRIEEIRAQADVDSAGRSLPAKMPTAPARRSFRTVSFGSRRSTGMCALRWPARNWCCR